jgi:dolichol-phosphate mannosyltransferase
MSSRDAPKRIPLLYLISGRKTGRILSSTWISLFVQSDSSLREPADELAAYCIAVVIPAYNAAVHVAEVIRSVPAFVRQVIVVDDASRDQTAAIVAREAERDPRVILVRHPHNQGVGGAMITGFREALARDAQLVVKMDADGQMSPDYLPDLLEPLVQGAADFAKGNRFHDFSALASMPWVRRLGNVGLSFLTKAAVGYWTCFDPCNGYIAIRSEVLGKLALDKLHRSYFFETSLLAQLYLRGAVIADVPMPAIYGNEVSHLRVQRTLVEFPPKLLGCLVRRLVLKHLLFDFSMLSIYALAAVASLGVGGLYGGYNFLWYTSHGRPAPTGTVVIPAMLITLGFQFLLAAIHEDLRAVPSRPLCRPLTPVLPLPEPLSHAAPRAASVAGDRISS